MDNYFLKILLHLLKCLTTPTSCVGVATSHIVHCRKLAIYASVEASTILCKKTRLLEGLIYLETKNKA